MRKNRNTRPYLAQFYRGNRLPFALGLLASALISVINLAVTWIIQQLMDTVSGAAGSLPLSTLAALTAAVIAAIVLLKCVNAWAGPCFQRRACEQYKAYAFERLTRKSAASFSQDNTAVYLSMFTNDLSTLETGYLSSLSDLLFNAILFCGSLVMMLCYNPTLTVIACAFFSLPIAAALLTAGRAAAAEKEVSEANGRFMATLKDCLGGFAAIKCFQAESAVAHQFDSENQRVEDTKRRKNTLSAHIGTMGAVAGIVAQLGVFLVGGSLALSGQAITPGILFAFINLTGTVIMPVQELPGLWAKRKASLALVQKLADALEEEPATGGTCLSAPLAQGIELQNVCAGYEEGQEVLRHVSAAFEPGKCYAVVGPSGSGKSTLLRLLSGEMRGYTGAVTLDGHELRTVSTDSLYALTSRIDQSVFLFQASLRENITMFQPFPNEEVDRAIRLAGLDQLMEQRGPEALCGENGAGLSGGEKQRVSIARSLLRKASVLLVDEATAALDAQTAYQVTDAILSLKQVTRIVVTHSLSESLLKRYDGILVLKGGSVAECGSFDDLMNRKGLFYSLYTLAQ